MAIWLSVLAVISGVIYVWTTYAGTDGQRYLFKPLTTILILGVALAVPAPVSELYR